MLDRVVHRYAAPLGLINGYLDVALPETYLRLAGLTEAAEDLHGIVLGAVLRQIMLTRTDDRAFRDGPLAVVRKPGLGVWFTDGGAVLIRLRKRPSSAKTGRPLQASADQLPLPGLGGLGLGEYELMILWSPDPQTQTLRRAVLAAVSHIDEPHLTTIHAEVDLPHATAASLGLAGVTELPSAEEPDDFDEDWPQQTAENTGDEPA